MVVNKIIYKKISIMILNQEQQQEVINQTLKNIEMLSASFKTNYEEKFT